MTKLKHTFKTDTLFKILFTKHQDLLKRFVAQLLGIHLDSITNFKITNPDIPPESLLEKFCRLDINMIVDGQLVDLEIQVKNEGDYPERSLYYWAREYSSALSSGGDYVELPRTIIISIVNFELFPCQEYYSEYRALEITRYTQLSDKLCLMYYELPKLPDEINTTDELRLWLALFKADTKEDLKRIEKMGVPVMNEAISAYNTVVVSSEFKEAERLRERARRNEAAARRYERKVGEKAKAIAIAKELIEDGELSIDKIAMVTGLTGAEIENLCNNKK